jgi:glycosyltransferase involved in cell wall biosynthesis
VLVAPGALDEYSAGLGTVAQDKDDRELVRGRVRVSFNFRRYAMDLLHGTPAAIPRVSVVLPNYNYAEYVGERISNVLDQTLPVYELVVLDDASDDGSVAAIEKALADCDVPWTLSVRERNSGDVVGQWAAGVQATTGDLVWIAETDDVADPNLVATLAASMTDEKVVLASCQSRQIDDNGDEIAPDYVDYLAFVDARDWRKPYVADGHDEIADCLAIMNTIPSVSATVIRRQVLVQALDRVAESTERHPSTGDWVVYIELLRHGSVAYESRSLSAHRRHSGSVIGRVNANEHLAEIAAVQQAVTALSGSSAAVRRRQGAYLDKVARDLGRS